MRENEIIVPKPPLQTELDSKESERAQAPAPSTTTEQISSTEISSVVPDEAAQSQSISTCDTLPTPVKKQKKPKKQRYKDLMGSLTKASPEADREKNEAARVAQGLGGGAFQKVTKI
mmetsp:Transcript_13890/g.18539  ORF Transcript_13890/g.18539 Transcript_13890/m.18539 type:complete len:117 (+) Transcript_13890:195-545(+)|eukprot:CAMPEP_0197294354 /NCGR_PEP_ID=MMETSP0890-20130614/32190_1 /TAXON_ID=44058 ORGANISM="Aureoumbra lagunensis, Strain CCMP1510" /NCGR_SAMPLE_ID=MMETSP0890 /ASSEMBLY_ACC=CAM_ASM_000533 /LENGTH=116 /DNA_ID=CAMNT_0042769727 /DNA_START=171 /DNA_END=521 /DNA_ORIENTATION=-